MEFQFIFQFIITILVLIFFLDILFRLQNPLYFSNKKYKEFLSLLMWKTYVLIFLVSSLLTFYIFGYI